MGIKRKIYVEIDDDSDVDMNGIEKGLKRLCRLSEDSFHFEKLFSRAVEYIYTTLPNGQINYSGKNSQIGHIWLGRFNNNKGNVNIEFNPSIKFKEDNHINYIQTSIAHINLREGTYSMVGELLKEDTEKVMRILGLKKSHKLF